MLKREFFLFTGASKNDCFIKVLELKIFYLNFRAGIYQTIETFEESMTKDPKI